jgi:hypothetical protein
MLRLGHLGALERANQLVLAATSREQESFRPLLGILPRDPGGWRKQGLRMCALPRAPRLVTAFEAFLFPLQATPHPARAGR